MKMELQILDWIQQMRTPVGDVWMVFISRLGNAGMIWILFTCLLLMIPRTRRWGVALAAALCLDAIICNILLKPMVCRIRPCDVNQTVQLIIARPADYSFPSGHTAASFAAVAALYFAGAKKVRKSVFADCTAIRWEKPGSSFAIAFVLYKLSVCPWTA